MVKDPGQPIKIYYQRLPGVPVAKWPIVEVKFSHLPQPILALIDSGASNSILHPEIADALGYPKSKLGDPQFQGKSASGDYKSWQLPRLNIEIYNYPIGIKFEVIDNNDLIWPCILGEDSIFEIAKLDFSKFKGYFEIQFRKDLN